MKHKIKLRNEMRDRTASTFLWKVIRKSKFEVGSEIRGYTRRVVKSHGHLL